VSFLHVCLLRVLSEEREYMHGVKLSVC